MIKKFYLSLVLLCCAIMGFAQNAIVRGYVYDEFSGEPISFADVYIQSENIGSTTDINGFYNIAGLKAGTYNFTVNYLGYTPITEEIVVSNNAIINKTFYLGESGIQLEEINVSANREAARTEIQVSKLSMTAKDIQLLPSVGGEADIAQYLQVLPGVISTGDQGGQLFIRGGSIVQNKILLDGLTIYNPFHTLGFFSVFETDLIRNADVYSGGFNAEFGGRTSAIVDIKTREGNKTRPSGFVSASPFLGKFLVEAPIKKFKKDEGSISMLFTGKKSIIREASKTFYPYALDNEDVGLPFDFQDLYGKLSFIAANGSKVNAFGFDFRDDYTNPSIANVGWKNQGAGLNFSLIPANSSIIVDGNVGATKYATTFSNLDADERASSITEFGAGLNFTFFMSESEIKYGLDLRGMTTNFNFINPFGIRLTQEQNTSELAAYIRYKATFGGLVVEPSFRIMYYAGQQRFSPEPRLGLKYNVTDRIRLKLAGGLYSQNILGTTNDRDIVNLFNAFLTGPESEVRDFMNQPLTNKLATAWHAVGGLEVDLNSKIVLNVEPYFKRFDQLIVINRNKLSAQDPDYTTETSDAYGIDLSVKAQYKRLYVWTTFSHAYVNRFDGIQEYPAIYDRRNNVNLLLSYDLDKAGNTQFSFRWNYGSGFPFTKTRGFYNEQNFGNGVLTDFLTNNPDQVGVIYSEDRNSGRLPDYHRLDVSFTRKFEFTKYVGAEIVASVTNAYNRENIFYFDRVKYDRENQLPVIPSLAIKLFF